MNRISATLSRPPRYRGIGLPALGAPRPARRSPEQGPEHQARPMSRAESHADQLLRELNHRVKNNFQIIVSLMNLKKRMLSRDRRQDVRFLEEHVMAMAVAYRLVYATGDMVEVGMAELVTEVAAGLRQIAELPADQLIVDTDGLPGVVQLDQAIAMGLYLAVVVPPCLDCARAHGGRAALHATLQDGRVVLTVAAAPGDTLALDFLGTRLVKAYVTQLDATTLPTDSPSTRRISFAVA